MDYTPNSARLWMLLIPAAAYLAWLSYLPTPAEAALTEGSIGVVLGLYICSKPAANGIDLFFLEHGRFRRIVTGWSGIGWLILNMFVMFVGWIVIVSGAAQLTSPRS